MAAGGNIRRKGDGKGRQGGRQKGTPNKVTKETKELLSNFVTSRWEDFVLSYDNIKDPEKKCQIMTQLIPYVVPKMASVEYKGDIPVKTLADELDEISGEKTRK